MVALALAGDHYLSKNCTKRLLLPTEEFSIRSSLQSMVESVVAIDEDEEIVADNEIFSAPSLGRPTFRGGHVSLSSDRQR